LFRKNSRIAFFSNLPLRSALTTPCTFLLLQEVLEHLAASTEQGKSLAQQATQSFWTEPPLNSIWDIWFNFMGYCLGEYIVTQWVLRSILNTTPCYKP